MSIPDPVYHPVIELFPPMSDADFQDLKADIAKNGLKTEIAVWKGQLIDGRHRVRALIELGIDWRRKAIEVDDDADPVEYALSCNLKRRHLNTSQLAMVADKVRGIYDEECAETKRATEGRPSKSKPKENLPEDKKSGNQARDKAAATVGVSGKLADAARTVRKMGTPELAKAVESGDVAVTAAAEIAKTLPPAKQVEAVKSGTVAKEAAKVRQEKKKPKSEREAVLVAVRDLHNTVDSILRLDLTPEELEPLFEAIGEIESKLTAAVSG